MFNRPWSRGGPKPSKWVKDSKLRFTSYFGIRTGGAPGTDGIPRGSTGTASTADSVDAMDVELVAVPRAAELGAHLPEQLSQEALLWQRALSPEAPQELCGSVGGPHGTSSTTDSLDAMDEFLAVSRTAELGPHLPEQLSQEAHQVLFSPEVQQESSIGTWWRLFGSVLSVFVLYTLREFDPICPLAITAVTQVAESHKTCLQKGLQKPKFSSRGSAPHPSWGLRPQKPKLAIMLWSDLELGLRAKIASKRPTSKKEE